MSIRNLLFGSLIRIKKAIKDSDIFAQKIMFTYKGKSSFSTVIGGLASILIITLILIYWGVLLNIMINRKLYVLLFYISKSYP